MGRTRLKYELDSGGITQISIADEKVAFAGAEPAGVRTIFGWNISARGSKRQRNRRIARSWIYQFEEETDSGLKAFVYYYFPKLTPAAYNANMPETLEYDDRTLKVVDRSPEG